MKSLVVGKNKTIPGVAPDSISTEFSTGREQGKVINFSDYGLTQLVENDTAAFQHFKQFGQRWESRGNGQLSESKTIDWG